jgi:hypothetical protein
MYTLTTPIYSMTMTYDTYLFPPDAQSSLGGMKACSCEGGVGVGVWVCGCVRV